MSKTIENLSKAFIGESQARNRYTFFASVARKEGYEQIAEIFTITADNERRHAKTLYEFLSKLLKKEKMNKVIVEAEMPLSWGKTIDHLKAAIAGEHHEFEIMYPEFASIAKKEGFPEIASHLKAIAIAESHHEERYKKILKELENGAIFKKKEKIWWVCRECGYVHFGTTPPDKCPSCDHEESFYQVKCEKF